MHVLRWGQSAYERDADLALERDAATALGWTWARAPDPRTVPDLAGVDILVVTSKCRVDRAVIAELSASHVLTTTSGFEHIDVAAAEARGIRCGRCPVARRDAVVETALGALLGLGKRWPDQLAAAERGDWARARLPELAPLGLRGSTVLLVGLGVIGRRMAEVLHALHAHVLGVDPAGVPDGVEAVSLAEGLARCDAVSLHVSMTPSARHLLDGPALARLPSHAVVVNTARGDALDLAAAVDAARSGRIRGLAVDVFPTEPYPRLARESAPQIWFWPHAAGYAPDLGHRVATEVAAALGAIAAGQPLPHPVRSAMQR